MPGDNPKLLINMCTTPIRHVRPPFPPYIRWHQALSSGARQAQDTERVRATRTADGGGTGGSNASEQRRRCHHSATLPPPSGHHISPHAPPHWQVIAYSNQVRDARMPGGAMSLRGGRWGWTESMREWGCWRQLELRAPPRHAAPHWQAGRVRRSAYQPRPAHHQAALELPLT
jgi:hypothetical protein